MTALVASCAFSSVRGFVADDLNQEFAGTAIREAMSVEWPTTLVLQPRGEAGGRVVTTNMPRQHGRRAGRRLGYVLVALSAASFVRGAPAEAHPLGNFTTNTATRVVVSPKQVRVTYIVDMAEIPALRVRQQRILRRERAARFPANLLR